MKQSEVKTQLQYYTLPNNENVRKRANRVIQNGILVHNYVNYKLYIKKSFLGNWEGGEEPF